ncbi:MAG: BamA/TamA family outer membrane protein [Saprospiraceae bacterium]|nr:BamA/TamA family outer membrane protein [Saprospiraceae bacterium]
MTSEGQISATLMLSKGQFFRLDSLVTEGFVRLTPYFLQQYLDLRKGEPLNRAKLARVSARLAALPFLQERRPLTLSFRENGTAWVNLLLDPKRASRWDFLVGVLPSTLPDGSQNFTVSFNGNADFHNLLGKGERIFANFENLRPQSPRLNLKFTYPYLFKTPLGFEGSFDLYKRDTQYLETHSDLGVQFLLGGNDFIKVFWNRYAANNLIINSLQIISDKKLPTTLDVTTDNFGIELAQQKLDYRFNPRRGWAFILRGSAGVRKVRKNADILNLEDSNDPTFDFSALYDTVSLRNFQYKIYSKSDFYAPIARRSTVRFGLQLGGIFTAEPISLNEQYRIGGTRILRGFNEEAIFATRYAVGTLEYRLLIGRNSYLFAFTDGGFVSDITRAGSRADMPVGFGAGIVFETKVGLFGFTLAAGKEQDVGVDF